MRLTAKMPMLTLTSVLLTALFSLNNCAPKPVPLGVTLDTPEHHVLSGMRLLELGRYRDALREFNLIKQSVPEYSKAFVGSGLVWAYQGNWEKAMQDMDSARRLATGNNENVFVNIGLIRLYLMGKDSITDEWAARAENAFNKTINLAPNSSEVHYYMGKVYEAAGNYQKAISLYKQVLKINKTHVDKARIALNLIKSLQKD